jgi:adenylyltransferase/sulfurtransferase
MPDGDRYLRQALVPEIGPAGQARLRRGRLLCVGAGGLGSAALPYLAGAGVGRITIMDPDRVDRTNLHRQVLYAESDVGRPKALAAAEHLRARNPDIEIVALEERFDEDNAERLLSEHDVVLDGSDNFATKFLLGDATAVRGIPLVYGSVTGMEAMVTVFDVRHGPCLRCVYPQPPQGWVPTCAEAGVLGPLVGMVGTIQAAEAVKLLAGEGRSAGLESLVGRLWVLDARDMSSRQLKIGKRDGCGTCAGTPDPLQVPAVSCAVPAGIDASEAAGLVDAVFVDVREREEYERGHIPGAIPLPLSSLEDGAALALPDAPRYLVYCSRGPRSMAAVDVLTRRGVTGVAHLQGGLEAWNGPLEPATDDAFAVPAAVTRDAPRHDQAPGPPSFDGRARS